jgi:ATP-dependent helicase/nuclease subunit A
MEELLSAALEFERNHPPSLQMFLDWLDRSDVEIKRDPSSRSNTVRVMTVHGAKGLQAPLVILADAATPTTGRSPDLLNWQVDDALILPVLRPPKAELAASLKSAAEASDEAEEREYWRLLYVALTRAEERLIVAGALGTRAKGIVPEGSWHAAVDRALMRMGVVADADGVKHYAVAGDAKAAEPKTFIPDISPALPAWLVVPAREEARPPRPLAPSVIETNDTEASPPPDDKMRAAAKRGKLLHSLFERLPAVAATDRRDAADRWLMHSAGVVDAVERAQLIVDAISVIEHPDFAAVFAPDVLAEAPLAGLVGDRVIAGTVDRLLIGERDVLVVDFKTGRRVPGGVAQVPEYHIAQMAAYVALLKGIFPRHAVRAGLLYTSGPRLIELPVDILEAHKPGYRAAQDKLIAAG